MISFELRQRVNKSSAQQVKNPEEVSKLYDDVARAFVQELTVAFHVMRMEHPDVWPESLSFNVWLAKLLKEEHGRMLEIFVANREVMKFSKLSKQIEPVGRVIVRHRVNFYLKEGGSKVGLNYRMDTLVAIS